MRKVNAVLSAVILLMFALHAILGSFNMMGAGSVTTKVLSWSMVALIVIHTVIGIILTGKSVSVWKKTGVSYFKENLLFWARRLSGFLIMILIFFHVTALSATNENGLRLPDFDSFKLAMQLLLVASIALHVITNVKPVLISFGIKKLKPKAGDIIFWLTVLLLLSAAGFIVYYIRWVSV